MRNGTIAIALGALALGAAGYLVYKGLDGNAVLRFLTTPLIDVGAAAGFLATPLGLAGILLLLVGVLQRASDRRAFPGAAPMFR